MAFSMEKVKDFEISKGTSADTLVKQMLESGGFTAKNFAMGVDILEAMLKEHEILNFLSFPACIIATGTRGIIRDMVKRKWFHVLVTTCGTLDHDLARCYRDYFQGDFYMDDKELHRKGISRIGNVLVPNASYGEIIEEKMTEILNSIYAEEKKELATYELCWEIGRRLNENSLLYWCWKNGIPVIVPGITDGAVGYQLWRFSQDHKDLKINVLKDEQLLNDMVWKAKKSGALIIGGGISKHHVLWWNLFKRGLDYAVYITTAVEYDGSLSGARPREAISWGKIREKAKTVTIEADATIALPIMYAALLERT
ncbi:deoxyhypusine synthase [Candidatus Bathyarchaeota archaeon]|nr:deoxyhypusine synthase [Candidatus Bathyarchaeota archaeon]